jgi:uncharacterized protein (TIGR00730 family)
VRRSRFNKERRSKKTQFFREEVKFLEGPQGRFRGILRVFRILWEFVRGFQAFHFLGPCITIFGSARLKENDPYYQMARETAARLARRGYTIMTGGGPGIMEAANRGAKDAGGRSIGSNILLPGAEPPNRFLDQYIVFRHFFVRKVMLVKYSYAFIAMPGGFGTLDEIFETATLIQTKKILNFPLVLMGVDYWKPLIDFMRNTMVQRGTIESVDVDKIILTDSPRAAEEYILQLTHNAFNHHMISYGAKKSWWKFP